MVNIGKYIAAFQKLRIDRTHGNAPHKPILLLSVLQAYQQEFISGNRIYITPELVGLFKSNWSLLVVTQHDCRFSYPFYYLKSAFFWRLVPKSGYDNFGRMEAAMKSFTNLNAAIEYAEIDDELAALMSNSISNYALQNVLLETYFVTTKSHYNLLRGKQTNLFEEIEKKILTEPPAQYQKEIQQLILEDNEEEIFLRGSVFKREIPKIYNNTCCISGMRIDAGVSISMIDACHIIPFSVGHDDTITNGIALCPNLHRAFDRGLITINEEYKVVVSPKLSEVSSQYSIKAFESKEIHLPAQSNYFPLKKNLEWHRENIFK